MFSHGVKRAFAVMRFDPLENGGERFVADLAVAGEASSAVNRLTSVCSSACMSVMRVRAPEASTIARLKARMRWTDSTRVWLMQRFIDLGADDEGGMLADV